MPLATFVAGNEQKDFLASEKLSVNFSLSHVAVMLLPTIDPLSYSVEVLFTYAKNSMQGRQPCSIYFSTKILVPSFFEDPVATIIFTKSSTFS